MRHSSSYWRLKRQLAKRRRDLLRLPGTNSLLYPDLGTAWFPSDREQALCDAFIVFTVAELETYFEAVLGVALDFYQNGLHALGLAECAAGTGYVEKIVGQRQTLSKNNNANWSRIRPQFEFVGLTVSRFPPDMWDDIESIVSLRGDAVHNSLGVRTVQDPRLTIRSVQTALRKIGLFDRDFVNWSGRMQGETDRLKSSSLKFIPGLGTLGVGAGARI
jgi:hypothetical protein